MKREEAIKEMREKLPWLTEDTKRLVEALIPELAESEDEWMLQTIIRGFENWKSNGKETFNFTNVDDILDYLEKQKEKEKYDRMMPVYDNLDSFESALAKAWKEYNDSGARTVDGCEDNYAECAHAKGFREGYLFGLEKQKEQKPDDDPLDDPKFLKGFDTGREVQRIFDEQKPEEKPINWTELTWKDINELEGIINNVHYEFRNGIGQESFGKEVLEKFREYKGDEYLDEAEQKYWQEDEQKPAEWNEDSVKFEEGFKAGRESGLRDGQKYVLNNLDSYGLCKPAEWSEEDKEMLLSIINAFRNGTVSTIGQEQWLKSLHKRFNLEPKQEWSEEDEKMINTLVDYLEYPSCWNLKCPREKLVAFIKSLPERFVLQPKQEWSEEDEDFINMLILHFNYLIDKGGDSVETYKSYIEKLKSLRPQSKQVISVDTEVLMAKLVNLLKSYRIGEETATTLANRIADTYGTQRYMDGLCDSGKLHWKPNEEQMEALNALNLHGDLSYVGQQNQLISLYQDLKKLM